MCRADSLTTMELRLPTRSVQLPAANEEKLVQGQCAIDECLQTYGERDHFDSERGQLICNRNGCANERQPIVRR
jgi:hypothetical protein